MCKVGLRGGGLDLLLEKWSVSITDHFWLFFPKWVQPPRWTWRCLWTANVCMDHTLFMRSILVWKPNCLCLCTLLFLDLPWEFFSKEEPSRDGAPGIDLSMEVVQLLRWEKTSLHRFPNPHLWKTTPPCVPSRSHVQHFQHFTSEFWPQKSKQLKILPNWCHKVISLPQAFSSTVESRLIVFAERHFSVHVQNQNTSANGCSSDILNASCWRNNESAWKMFDFPRAFAFGSLLQRAMSLLESAKSGGISVKCSSRGLFSDTARPHSRNFRTAHSRARHASNLWFVSPSKMTCGQGNTCCTSNCHFWRRDNSIRLKCSPSLPPTHTPTPPNKKKKNRKNKTTKKTKNKNGNVRQKKKYI